MIEHPEYPESIRRRDAEKFIEALTGGANTVVTFLTFCEASGDQPQFFHDTIGRLWDRLDHLNQQGHGIFMMVNEGDGRGRRTENVVALRALFIDDDGKQALAPLTASLPPSIIVQSKAGPHIYFVLKPGEPLSAFTGAQRALAAHFGTDPAVSDLPRVMRVPGFFHMKDPKDPFLVTLRETTNVRSTIDEILAHYPAPPPDAGHEGVAPEQRLRRARAYATKVPFAVEGAGGDTQTLKLAAALVNDFDLTEEEAWPILIDWNAGCSPPWPESELRTKLTNATRYGTHPKGAKLKTAWKPNDERRWSFSAAQVRDVCVPILDENFRLYRDEKTGTTREYRVMGGEASLVMKDSLMKKVLYDGLKAITSEYPPLDLLGRSLEIWRTNTAAIHQDPLPFAFAGDDRLAFKRFDWTPSPRPHPAWEEFTSRLSDAPGFMAFIWSIFEPTNTGRQYLWLHGNGEDGKSVVLGVIVEIFGPAGLGASSTHFSKENRFFFSSLWGKRVVAYADCKNPKFGMTEMVRNITSGDPVLIEFKNKDSFSGVINCKLLVASNDAPEITTGDADMSRCFYVKVAESKTKDDPAWRDRLRAELPGFLAACQQHYRELCPHGGKIRLSEASRELRAEAAADFESEFEEVFGEVFCKDDKAEMPAFQFRQLLKDAGFDDQKIHDFKLWMQRKHGITRHRTAAGAFYPGLKSVKDVMLQQAVVAGRRR